MATADEIRAQAAAVRERAKTLHDTANRADASHYTERGGQLDDADAAPLRPPGKPPTWRASRPNASATPRRATARRRRTCSTRPAARVPPTGS